MVALQSGTIRRLGPADHASCVALSADRGWAPEERSWSFLLSAAQAYGIDAPDGDGLAGSVVLARYGAGLASVGMMLVASRYSRRGLGRALLGQVLAEAGDATVFLVATAAGRPLYLKLGFRDVRANGRFIGRFAGEPDHQPSTRIAADADLPAITDLDRVAFGAGRGFLLRRYPALATQLRVLADPRGGLAGYAGAWRNGEVTVIGPVVAASDAAARSLIAGLAVAAAGPVRLDLDPDRAGLPAWLAGHGVPQVARSCVMARGPWPPPGRRDWVYAPLSVALS